jgi:hypothetical protein
MTKYIILLFKNKSIGYRYRLFIKNAVKKIYKSLNEFFNILTKTIASHTFHGTTYFLS